MYWLMRAISGKQLATRVYVVGLIGSLVATDDCLQTINFPSLTVLIIVMSTNYFPNKLSYKHNKH